MGRFQTEEEAVRWLNSCCRDTGRTAVFRERELLKRLGDPQKKLRFVHVGGTNGKGSTCAMTESICRAAGYRTGMFPSPFLEKFNERIQVSCRPIPGETLARLAETVADAAESMEEHPRHFELITAIGMLYFLEQNCDIVVLEVGMGGEYDSTNAIDAPEAAVITNIGLDHTEYLGNTVEEIARTKSGIIKPGCCAVLYDLPEAPRAVLEEKAAVCGVPVYRASDVQLTPLRSSLRGQTFSADGREYRLSLLGAHQLQNVRVVLKTVEALRDRGWKIPEDAVRKGLEEVRWPARFEVLSEEPVFILDGGHNPQCAAAVAETVKQYLPGEKITLLAGMLADKDVGHALDCVLPAAAEAVTAAPDSHRAMTAEELAARIRERGYAAGAADSTEKAIRMALETGRPVVVFGSLYLAGKVRSCFRTVFKQWKEKSEA